MSNTYKIGHDYLDIIGSSRKNDQFVSWFSIRGSGIGNSGGIRPAKFIKEIIAIPAYIVVVTRNISHRHHNPWEDVVDYSSGKIYYWGDAKKNIAKTYNEFKGNKTLLSVYEALLEGDLATIPPILHFSKIEKGKVRFNGLCVLTGLELTWFEDQFVPVKNYRFELTILDQDIVEIEWLHQRVRCGSLKQLNIGAPNTWYDFIRGNTRKLDIWRKDILSKDDQLPTKESKDAGLLEQLRNLTPTEFEAVVVEIFKNLPHVSHKITRTRPTADGGFDFFGQFVIPFPIGYEINFLGEAKRFSRDTAVQPKHVSRLVARLSRGQFGIFVTTSYYTRQTQKEILEDGYPVKLFSGLDCIRFLHEIRAIQKGELNKMWLESVIKEV